MALKMPVILNGLNTSIPHGDEVGHETYRLPFIKIKMELKTFKDWDDHKIVYVVNSSRSI